MKHRTLVIAALLALLVCGLSGCNLDWLKSTAMLDAESSRYYAQAEASRAASAQAAADARIAEAGATTAQVAQVEATNRLMAFLATATVAGQSNMALVILIIGVGALGAYVYTHRRKP